MAVNLTRVNCLEGSYAHHYTTDAFLLGCHHRSVIIMYIKKGQTKESLLWPAFEPGLLRPQRRVLTARDIHWREKEGMALNLWKVIDKEIRSLFKCMVSITFCGVTVITSALHAEGLQFYLKRWTNEKYIITLTNLIVFFNERTKFLKDFPRGQTARIAGFIIIKFYP